jgi:hypothetical protein
MNEGYIPSKGTLNKPPRIDRNPNRPPDPLPLRKFNIPEHTKIVCAFCNQEVSGDNHSCIPFLIKEIAKLKMQIYRLETRIDPKPGGWF